MEEVLDYEKYRNVFKWKPSTDAFNHAPEKSNVFSNISKHLGVEEQALLEEYERRKNVLAWMRSQSIRSYRDVAGIITEYYSRPKEFYERRVGDFVANQQP